MFRERIPEADLFIVLAYDTLRADMDKGEKYQNLHTVWNGFNRIFRLLFPGFDVVAYTKFLAEEELVIMSPARGGMFLRPSKTLIAEAQKGQEELGLRMLRYLEDFVASERGAPSSWIPESTSAALTRLGY